MNSRQRLPDFSSLSIISIVEKFVKTVDTMNETVMVPSRLLNVELPLAHEKVPPLLRGNCDPYTFYTVLNSVRNNLVWGLTEADKGDEEETKSNPEDSAWFSQNSEGGKYPSTCSEASSSTTKSSTKGHVRRTSSMSSVSVASGTSEQENERLSDAGDSGVDSEEVEAVADITASLRSHMVGLQKCLLRLTDTATYITDIYQEEVKA